MAMTGGTAKLVKTGYANYGKAGAIKLYVYYKITQSVSANTSTVSCGMYVTTPTSVYAIGGWSDSAGSYVGTSSLTFDGTIPSFAGTRWLAENKSFTVKHDSKGEATATIAWKWGVNSPWGQMVKPSGSFTVPLPTIQRGSVPTLSAYKVNLGQKLTVYTNRASGSYTHTVTYSFNGATGTIGTGVTDKAEWTLPLDLAKKIRSSPSGTGPITCKTYNGSTRIGTQSVGFTALVPENDTTKPTITGFTVSPSGSLPSAYSGLYIQGKTGVTATVSASSVYSDVASYAMTADGITYKGNPATSLAFSSAGEKAVTVTVTDARGFTRTQQKTVTVLPYTAPSVVPYTGEKAIICARCTQDGTLSDDGTYLRIRCGRKYEKVTVNNIQKNTCTLGYSVVQSGGQHITFSPLLTAGAMSDLADVVLPNCVASITTAYSVQLRVSDDLSGAYTYTFTVPTANISFHLADGGHGAAFGALATKYDGVLFAWDVYGRAYGLGKLEPIPNNADLNDYKAFGMYAVTSDAGAKTVSNLPIEQAGRLMVYSATGDGRTGQAYTYIAQEYFTYKGAHYYRRLRTGATPNVWAYEAWATK